MPLVFRRQGRASLWRISTQKTGQTRQNDFARVSQVRKAAGRPLPLAFRRQGRASLWRISIQKTGQTRRHMCCVKCMHFYKASRRPAAPPPSPPPRRPAGPPPRRIRRPAARRPRRPAAPPHSPPRRPPAPPPRRPAAFAAPPPAGPAAPPPRRPRRDRVVPSPPPGYAYDRSRKGRLTKSISAEAASVRCSSHASAISTGELASVASVLSVGPRAGLAWPLGRPEAQMSGEAGGRRSSNVPTSMVSLRINRSAPQVLTLAGKLVTSVLETRTIRVRRAVRQDPPSGFDPPDPGHAHVHQHELGSNGASPGRAPPLRSPPRRRPGSPRRPI